MIVNVPADYVGSFRLKPGDRYCSKCLELIFAEESRCEECHERVERAVDAAWELNRGR